MKSFLILAVAVFVPAIAFGQYDASTATTNPSPARETETPVSSGATSTPTSTPEEAQVDVFIKYDGVDGESEDSTPEPSSEHSPSTMSDEMDGDDDKTEETKESGEKSGTEDINIGVGELQEAVDSFFDIIVDVAETDEGDPDLPVVNGILLEGLQEADLPAEEVAFNYEKITMKVRHEVRLFGFIPVDTTADVEVDADGGVKVKFPWWRFLASGTDADGLGNRVRTSLTNALRASHDTMMNSIRNMK